MRLRASGDGLWCAGDNQTTALVPAFRPQVEDPIRALDHIEVVFDHEHRVPRLDEALEAIKQALNLEKAVEGADLVVNRFKLQVV